MPPCPAAFGFRLCKSGPYLLKLSSPHRFFCYDPSVFVLGTPGSSGADAPPGNHSGVRQLTGSMGLSPLRGSHRAAWANAQAEVSLCCDASWLYAGSCPALTGRFPLMSRKTVMAFTAAVAPHHRFVPDECIFSCEGAFRFPGS